MEEGERILELGNWEIGKLKKRKPQIRRLYPK